MTTDTVRLRAEHKPGTPPAAQGQRWVHRLLLRLYGLQPDMVLNSGPACEGHPFQSAELMRRARALQAAIYAPGRGRLDYALLSGNPLLAGYRQQARRLQSFNPAVLTTPAERLAFWLNLYNALIIDAVISFGVIGSVQEVSGFFWRAAYNVGGLRYSAHDIEHGILRANAPHPAIPGAHFASGDPRHQHSLDRLDPRIHFALVCGARSCPPIAFYDAARLEEQLDHAARSFVNGHGVVITPRPRAIWLSKIFQWYAPDFGAAPFGLGASQPLRRFIARYLDGNMSRAALLDTGWPVRYQRYDWRLNAEAG
jgi:hypothetical protein